MENCSKKPFLPLKSAKRLQGTHWDRQDHKNPFFELPVEDDIRAAIISI